MPTVDIYSKQQVDALIAGAGGLPDPTSASAGDVLALDSNKDPAWVAPSGGSAWEYINPANMPQDFSSGDRLLLFMCVGLGINASGSDWNATLSGLSFNTNTNVENTNGMITIQNDDNGCGKIISSSHDNTNVRQIVISSVKSLTNWNSSSTSLNLLTLKGYAFNAHGIVSSSVNLTKANIGMYVKAIYRFKPQ